jgi:uncharacterized protein (TIGR02246 family)
MHKTLLTASLVWGLASLAQAAEPAPADVAALTALARAADAAWDAADAPRMSGLYTPDASLMVGGTGDVRGGREAVSAYFGEAFANRPAVMRHVTEVRRADLLAPDLALTDNFVRVEVRQADGAWREARRFHTVSLAERTAAGWRLRAVRAFPLP